MTQKDVVALMKKKQGDRMAKEFAEELEISPQYLSDIYLGKREPGPSVLGKLGLERDTIYREVEA